MPECNENTIRNSVLFCNCLYILTHTILSVHAKDARRRFCFYLKRYIWLKVKETVTFCLWVCMVFRKVLRKENQRVHVPPVSVVNLQACFSVLCRRTPPHECECNIAQVDISRGNTSGPTTKTTGCEMLLKVVLYSARSRCINQEQQVGFELVFKTNYSVVSISVFLVQISAFLSQFSQ